jgi:hypothetical protein
MQCLPFCSITTSNWHIYVEVSLHPLFQCIWCPRVIIFKVFLVSTNKISYITSCAFILSTTNMSRVVGFNLNISPSSICRSANPPVEMFLSTDCTDPTRVIMFVYIIKPLLHSKSLQCPLKDIRILKLIPNSKLNENFQIKLLIELPVPFLLSNIIRITSVHTSKTIG